MIRKQLAKILSSDVFLTSERYRRFLTFLVEMYIEDSEKSFSAFEIAVDCFGRTANPEDPYVRNIASGVRRALRNYYQQTENRNQLTILLPRVGYCLNIDWLSELDKRGEKYNYNSNFLEREDVTVLVLPLRILGAGIIETSIGEIIANIINFQISRHQDLSIISRLSASVFEKNAIDMEQLKNKYGINYIIDGYYRLDGETLRVGLILHELYTFHQLSHKEISVKLSVLDYELEGRIIEAAISLANGIIGYERDLIRVKPLNDILNHTLIISGSYLMHSRSQIEFFKARDVLIEATHRRSTSAKNYSLLSWWCLLAKFHGFVRLCDDEQNGLEMSNYCSNAVNLDTSEPSVYTMLGAYSAYFEDDLYSAHRYYDQALSYNPSHALSLGLKGAAYAFADEGEAARKFSEKAISLSPFDPALYMYKSILATAADSMDDFIVAEQEANEAYRLNPSHLSSLRLLISSKVNLGKIKSAKKYAAELNQSDLGFNLEQYARQHPGSHSDKGQRLINNLEMVGVRRN